MDDLDNNSLSLKKLASFSKSNSNTQSFSKILGNVLNGNIIQNKSDYFAKTWIKSEQNIPLSNVDNQRGTSRFLFIKMSIKEKLLLSLGLMLFSLLCLALSCLYIPVLLLKARKFALLYSLSSLSGMSGLLILIYGIRGNNTKLNIVSLSIFQNYFNLNKYQAVPQEENIIEKGSVTQVESSEVVKNKYLMPMIVYLISGLSTIYFALWWKNTILTIISCIIQFFSIMAVIIKMIPGGGKSFSLLKRLVIYSCKRNMGSMFAEEKTTTYKLLPV